MRMTMIDWTLLFGLSVLWGGSFFFAGVAVRELPPLTLALCRVALAASALAAFLALRRGAPFVPPGVVWPRLVGALAVMGLFNNVIPFSLLFWAQTQIGSGLASILNATTPIFSAIIAHATLADERLTMGRFLGVVLGVAGVAVLLGIDAAGYADAELAMGACLLAALSYGAASVYGRRFRRMGVGSVTVACGQLAASTAILLPLAAAADRPWTLPQPSPEAAGAVVALALVSTALAYVLYFRVLASAGAVAISLVTVLIPATAVLLGYAVLDEPVLPRQGAGMALIALALLIVDGRLCRRLGRAVAADR